MESEMMTVNDALEAGQAGEITAARAMRLTGAADVMELHAFSAQSGVDIRTRLLPREEEQANRATELVNRLIAEEDGAAIVVRAPGVGA